MAGDRALTNAFVAVVGAIAATAGLAGCIPGSTMQGAFSAPRDTFRVVPFVALAVAPARVVRATPGKPPPTGAALASSAFGILVEMGLRHGLQPYWGLTLTGSGLGLIAGGKLQLVGDADSLFAIAVVGDGRAQVMSTGKYEDAGGGRAQIDLLAGVQPFPGVRVSFGGRLAAAAGFDDGPNEVLATKEVGLLLDVEVKGYVVDLEVAQTHAGHLRGTAVTVGFGFRFGADSAPRPASPPLDTARGPFGP